MVSESRIAHWVPGFIRTCLYQNQELIGKGSFGEVFKAYSILRRQKVAIKKVRLRSSKRKLLKFWTRSKSEGAIEVGQDRADVVLEMQRWSLCKYIKYTVSLFEYVETRSFAWFVMELAPLGDLAEFTDSYVYTNEIQLSFEIIKEIFAGVFIGLRAMHEKGIIHMDIKPDNIFLTHNLIPKIGDFGSCIEFDVQKGKNALIGSVGVEFNPIYAPPEVFCRKPLNLTFDTFAVVLSMLYVKFNESAWEHGDPILRDHAISVLYSVSCQKRLLSNEWSEERAERCFLTDSRVIKLQGDKLIAEDFDNSPWTDDRYEFSTFAKAMLRWSVKKRPTIADACEHPYMRDSIARWEESPENGSAYLRNLLQNT